MPEFSGGALEKDAGEMSQEETLVMRAATEGKKKVRHTTCFRRASIWGMGSNSQQEKKSSEMEESVLGQLIG